MTSEQVSGRTRTRLSGRQAAAAFGRFMRKKNGMWRIIIDCYDSSRKKGLCLDQKLPWGRPDAPSCSTHVSFFNKELSKSWSGSARAQLKKDFSGGKKIINTNCSAPANSALHGRRPPIGVNVCMIGWMKGQRKALWCNVTVIEKCYLSAVHC